MATKMTLGQYVRDRRKHHLNNLSQRELAQRMGMSREYISQIENDRVDILPFETMQSLASALYVDVTELMRVAGLIPDDMPSDDPRTVEFALRFNQLSPEDREAVWPYVAAILEERLRRSRGGSA